MKINGLKAAGMVVAAAALLFAGGIAGSALERRAPGANLQTAPDAAIWGEHTVDETGVVFDPHRDSGETESVEAVTESAEEAVSVTYVAESTPEAPAEAPAVVQVVESPPTPAPPTPEATPQVVAPYVVSIAPADGEIGVAPDAAVEVTFSEPMDESSAEAAFGLSSGECGNFIWNSSQTVVSFDPCSDWPYGTAVTVEVDDDAAALSGATLEKTFESEFRVLRQSQQTLYSEADYDGSVRSLEAPSFAGQVFLLTNGFSVSPWSRGFISFDLSELPADVVAIQFAEVGVFQHTVVNAYGPETGPLLIESVSYGTLNYEDWFDNAHSLCSKICIGKNPNLLSDDASLGWKSRNVSVAVNNDWQHRDNRDLRSQFRLRFQKECPATCNADSYAIFYAGEAGGPPPYLQLTYTHP